MSCIPLQPIRAHGHLIYKARTRAQWRLSRSPFFERVLGRSVSKTANAVEDDHSSLIQLSLTSNKLHVQYCVPCMGKTISVADPGLMKGGFSGDTKILARGCSQRKMGQSRTKRAI